MDWNGCLEGTFSDLFSKRNLLFLLAFWLSGAAILVTYGTSPAKLAPNPSLSSHLSAFSENGTGAFLACRTSAEAGRSPYRVAPRRGREPRSFPNGRPQGRADRQSPRHVLGVCDARCGRRRSPCPGRVLQPLRPATGQRHRRRRTGPFSRSPGPRGGRLDLRRSGRHNGGANPRSDLGDSARRRDRLSGSVPGRTLVHRIDPHHSTRPRNGDGPWVHSRKQLHRAGCAKRPHHHK